VLEQHGIKAPVLPEPAVPTAVAVAAGDSFASAAVAAAGGEAAGGLGSTTSSNGSLNHSSSAVLTAQLMVMRIQSAGAGACPEQLASSPHVSPHVRTCICAATHRVQLCLTQLPVLFVHGPLRRAVFHLLYLSLSQSSNLRCVWSLRAHAAVLLLTLLLFCIGPLILTCCAAAGALASGHTPCA
jgi:hypothetical protein